MIRVRILKRSFTEVKILLSSFFASLLVLGYAQGGEGDSPPPPDSSTKSPAVKVENKKFKDENKDGFNDLRDKGSYERFLKEALKERKGKK